MTQILPGLSLDHGKMTVTKKDFSEMLAMYKDQISLLKENIESLREDKQKLSDQISKLQDGILAIRAPEVYRDYRNDMIPEVEIPQEEKERLELMRTLTKNYLDNIERPLFKNAADMEEMLAPTLFSDIEETESLHGNDES